MALRDRVRDRADDRCEYCCISQRSTVLPHEMDHIRAQKHHGPTTLDNLCWSCAQCNAAKGPNIAGYDPVGGKLSVLFNPRAQEWSEHFSWDEALLIGHTPEGRTTIDVLNINARDRVEHRSLLLASDSF